MSQDMQPRAQPKAKTSPTPVAIAGAAAVEPDLAEMTARILPQWQLQSELEPKVQLEPEPDLAAPDLAGLMAR